jgi:hypothetical protein
LEATYGNSNKRVENAIDNFSSERRHASALTNTEGGLIVKSERRAVRKRVRLGGLLNYYHREEKEVGKAA